MTTIKATIPTFVGYWSNDFDNAGTYEWPAENFSTTYGYSEEDVKAIHSLAVGQVWISRHYGGSHTVTRTA